MPRVLRADDLYLQFREDPGPHRHPHWELVQALDGAYGVRCDGRDIALRPGQMVVYPPGHPHQPDIRPTITGLRLLQWTDDPRGPQLPRTRVLVIEDVDVRLVAGLQWIIELWRRRDATHRRAAAKVLAAFVLELVDAVTEPPLVDAADPLDRALGFMRRNPHKRHSLRSLAAGVGLHPRRFADRFRERFGVTPMRHLRRIRCDRALELLRGTTMTCRAIAAAVGFPNEQYLSRVMKHRFGVSPERLRSASP